MLTLTAEGCAARRSSLIDVARREGLDLVLITNPHHLHYYAGLFISQLALSAYGPNALLIDAQSGESTLVVHNWLAEAARLAPVDRVEVWRWYDAGELPGRDPYTQGVIEINTHLAAHAGQHSGRRVGIELGWLPHGVALADPHPVNLTPAILDQRRRKHPDELALIREALATCEAGHRAVRDLLLGAAAADLTELEVYNTAHAAMVGHLGGPVHLLGDFAGGKRAETTGGPPTSNRLTPGDLMIVDMFPIVNGYRADFTATYAVGGMMRGVAAALDAALHEALAAGEALLRPGMKAGDIYRAVRSVLDVRGFGAGFPHHAGHGLGLGHPEAPYFVPASEETLIEGDVVTLEPGSYGDGYGARIEHNYLITATGAERLTHHNTQMR